MVSCLLYSTFISFMLVQTWNARTIILLLCTSGYRRKIVTDISVSENTEKFVWQTLVLLSIPFSICQMEINSMSFVFMLRGRNMYIIQIEVRAERIFKYDKCVHMHMNGRRKILVSSLEKMQNRNHLKRLYKQRGAICANFLSRDISNYCEIQNVGILIPALI